MCGRDVIYIYFLQLHTWLIPFSCIYLLSISFEDGKVLESIPGFARVFESRMDLNIDLTRNYYIKYRI